MWLVLSKTAKPWQLLGGTLLGPCPACMSDHKPSRAKISFASDRVRSSVFESPHEVDLIDTLVMHVLVATFATLRWWCKDDTKGRLCPWVRVVVGSCFTTGIPYVTCAYLEFAASPLLYSSFTARGVLLHSIVTCITCIYTSLPTNVAWLK